MDKLMKYISFNSNDATPNRRIKNMKIAERGNYYDLTFTFADIEYEFTIKFFDYHKGNYLQHYDVPILLFLLDHMNDGMIDEDSLEFEELNKLLIINDRGCNKFLYHFIIVIMEIDDLKYYDLMNRILDIIHQYNKILFEGVKLRYDLRMFKLLNTGLYYDYLLGLYSYKSAFEQYKSDLILDPIFQKSII